MFLGFDGWALIYTAVDLWLSYAELAAVAGCLRALLDRACFIRRCNGLACKGRAFRRRLLPLFLRVSLASQA